MDAKFEEQNRKTVKTQRTTERERDPGQIPVRSLSQNTKIKIFIKRWVDLPCKRTCHGKGRNNYKSIDQSGTQAP